MEGSALAFAQASHRGYYKYILFLLFFSFFSKRSQSPFSSKARTRFSFDRREAKVSSWKRLERFFNNEIQLVAFHFPPPPVFLFFTARPKRNTERERQRKRDRVRKQARKTFSHSLHFDSLAKCLARGKQSYKLRLLFLSPSPSPSPSKISSNQRISSNEEIKAIVSSFFSFFSFFIFPRSFNRQRPSIHPWTSLARAPEEIATNPWDNCNCRFSSFD